MRETKPESSYSRRFSEEFKQGAVRLVVGEEYTFKAAAAAAGVGEQTLRHWHAKLAPKPVECGEDATLDQLREENKRLRRKLRRAELERWILKKSHGVFRERVAVKYAWIRQHRDSFSVLLACQVLEVSTSGYYSWSHRAPSPRAQRAVRVRQAVREVHAQSHGIYGSVKVAEALQERDDLEHVCRNTVAQAMRDMGLKSRVLRAFTPTTTQVDPRSTPAPNTLAQDFTAEAQNRKWVADVTYLATEQGWVYLAVVLDLFSRKAVGWALGPSLETELVSAALRRAIEARRPERGRLLHHSDRGCQYTSDTYQRTLETLGIQCSMSRTGCCYDNAVMERFFWSLKHEWTKHQIFTDLEAARVSVFKYVETFYNPVRLHQTLGYKAPNQ